MNIIIPLAGTNKFDNKHFFYPPPLVEVEGLPLIQYVTENLKMIKGNNKFIYIINEEDSTKYHLDNTLKLLTPNCEIVILKSQTKGSVFSILMGIDIIDKEKETIISNADQLFNLDLNIIVENFRKNKSDGGVITFDSVHPRWSYVKSDRNNNVLYAIEKNPISKNAVAGFYYFKSFKSFVECSFNAIEIEDYHNGRLYTSALINQLILLQKKVLNFHVDSQKYKSFYSPQKIKEFQEYIVKKN